MAAPVAFMLGLAIGAAAVFGVMWTSMMRPRP
jgi:hypothetical protein